MKKIVFVLFIAVGIGGLPTEVLAGCFDDAALCFQRAARRPSVLTRTLAGLDCELDLIECARRKIIGR